MTVGQRIRECRKKLKMSADELGSRIGKDRSTVFRYEKGEIDKMPVDILKPIAQALNTTPAYLMGWTDEVPPSPSEEDKLLNQAIELMKKLTPEQQKIIITLIKAMAEGGKTESLKL